MSLRFGQRSVDLVLSRENSSAFRVRRISPNFGNTDKFVPGNHFSYVGNSTEE